MRILLTNSFLATRTGSEMVVRDFALALKARGHEVAVYAPVLTRGWRALLGAGGVAAADDLGALAARPDVVHGQHTLAFLKCVLAFPDAPVVQWIHDLSDPVDLPLAHPSIAHWIAVDEARAARVRDAGLDGARVSVVANAVDLTRFPLRDAGAEKRAICIVKRAGLEATIEAVRRGAASAEWTVDFVGAGMGQEVEALEALYPNYAAAITSGRCALEAIAMGRAAIVSDYDQIAGLASAETWDDLRRGNFGLKAMRAPISEGAIAEALCAVDLAGAHQFARRVRDEMDLSVAAERVEAIYRRVVRTHAPYEPRDVRLAWARDLDALAMKLGEAHLAHWRRIADAADQMSGGPPRQAP